MAKQKNAVPPSNQQLSMDNLFDLLEQEPDKLHKLPIYPEDIGAELLAVLTKGLYTNPLDSIREYIQNAVDAKAKNLIIKITGNSVSVRDDGNGMSLEDLLQARQFGLSSKFIVENVGFRGIGIYSGFDLCRRLRITTKKSGDDNIHVLVFAFADMKAQLEGERRVTPQKGDIKVESQKTSLLTLLSEHTYIKREKTSLPATDHFTQVELQDINDFHISHLNDRAEVRKYLLQNLPIDFADDFKHKKAINDKLIENIDGYFPIKIILQSDNVPDEIVDKYSELDLQPPTFGVIINSKTKQRVAYYWACLNTKNDKIDPLTSDNQRPKYGGFVYKVKGFTVGDRAKLRKMFLTRDQLYPWYTGEIYVLDPNMVPNAERNDFESGWAKDALELELAQEVEKTLKPDALKFQARGRAKEVLETKKKEFKNISDQLAGNQREPGTKFYKDTIEIVSALSKMIDSLRQQKKTLQDQEDKTDAEELLKSADTLQKQLFRDANKATPQVDRQKQAARDQGSGNRSATEETSSSTSTSQGGPESTASHEKNEAPTGSGDKSGAEDNTQPAPLKTLHSILSSAGWEIDGNVSLLADAVQSALEDVLSSNIPAYLNLLDLIDLKLSSNGADE